MGCARTDHLSQQSVLSAAVPAAVPASHASGLCTADAQFREALAAARGVTLALTPPPPRPTAAAGKATSADPTTTPSCSAQGTSWTVDLRWGNLQLSQVGVAWKCRRE